MRTVVAMTGASGSIFGLELMRRLPGEVYAILSRWGQHVLREEMNLGREDVEAIATRLFYDADLSAPLASGSNRWESMIVLPCSTSTVGKIASGIADSLVTRAAAVTLKERRRLVLCPRETPLSAVILRQLAELARDGVTVMPVSPGWYGHPGTLDDLVHDFVDRVLQILGVEVPGGWRAEELEGARRSAPIESVPGGKAGTRTGVAEGDAFDLLDTSMVPIYAAMTPSRRLATAFGAIDFMRRRIRTHLRQRNPDWTDEQIEAELAARIRRGAG